ncbi:hypothetical protein pb186bvf_007433 [Paramecium bursaria]
MNSNAQGQNKQFQEQINAINDEYQHKINQVFQNWKQKPIIIFDDDVKQEYKIDQEIQKNNDTVIAEITEEIQKNNVTVIAEITENKVVQEQRQPPKKRAQKCNSNQSKNQKRMSKIQRYKFLYNEDQVQLDNQRLPKIQIKCGNQPFFIYLSIRSKQLNVQYTETLQICKREWAIMDVTEKQIYKLMFLERKQLKSDKETSKESVTSKQGEFIE